MKTILVFILTLSFSTLFSQEQEVKQVVDDFFIGFHNRDSIALNKTCHEYVIMQTIGKDKEGNNKLIKEVFTDFITSIVSIPKDVILLEKLLDYKIQIDGALAHVWTPYEFYVNGKLSHTGVNSFTLFKENENWQIIHVIDTRKK
jgi:hypothetical protein